MSGTVPPPEVPGARFLVLLRHGIAEERSLAVAEAARQLTPKGAQRMEEIGRALALVLPAVGAIVTSPLTRAVQTGDCLAHGFGAGTTVQASEALAPGSGVEAVRALLATLPCQPVILVGHEPDLTGLLGDFCGLDTHAMSLKKGGCYGVKIEGSGEMTLEWMLPPALLRHIRK